MLLPAISAARSAGARSLDDMLPIVAPIYGQSFPWKRPLKRLTLYRVLIRLRELGLDPGPDDLSTARKLGRPTRGHKQDRLE